MYLTRKSFHLKIVFIFDCNIFIKLFFDIVLFTLYYFLIFNNISLQEGKLKEVCNGLFLKLIVDILFKHRIAN